MKTIIIFFLIIITALILTRCDHYNPVTTENILPVPLEGIDSIVATSHSLIVYARYTTPSKCWKYYETKISGDEHSKNIIVYAKEQNKSCFGGLGSIISIDTLYFNSAGLKKLSFWKDISSYYDTTVGFASIYKIKFPDFFLEKGSDADSSYISFRGTKINPYLYEIRGTGWGIIESGILIHQDNYPRKIVFLFMGECGTLFFKTWIKAERSLILTADVLDTVDVLAFTNGFRHCRDTLFVTRY